MARLRVHRLDPTHHSRQIFGDRQIAAGRLRYAITNRSSFGID
jgi:hypothetical protein